MGSVSHVEEERGELANDVQRLARLGVRLMSISDGGVTVQNGAESSLVVEVKEMQDSDPILLELKGAVHNKRVEVFSQGGDGGTHGHHPHTVDGLTVRPAGSWFLKENFPRTQSENLAKSRLTDRLTVRRCDHGPWSVSMDRDFLYPASNTNYGRPARTVIQYTVRRSDRR
ncbi:hypothetical protein MTR67_039369 [Solanum verrucosum]|uniref:Uncharacterized protein n=1 Tax=Solanum verrucosum TaxID=315347 RepID=A0AAF0UHJ8_SOLVR|nr:hypothetical protein MTR67_039369 [Solanum verrucosum]